jgi:hypothetical protein
MPVEERFQHSPRGGPVQYSYELTENLTKYYCKVVCVCVCVCVCVYVYVRERESEREREIRRMSASDTRYCGGLKEIGFDLASGLAWSQSDRQPLMASNRCITVRNTLGLKVVNSIIFCCVLSLRKFDFRIAIKWKCKKWRLVESDRCSDKLMSLTGHTCFHRKASAEIKEPYQRYQGQSRSLESPGVCMPLSYLYVCIYMGCDVV